MNIIETLEREEMSRLNKTIPDFAPGDTVIVNVNVVEGERKRVQAYEGVDERVVASEVDEEIAIGDFVVSGGELPVLMLIDAIARQLPGALNDADSAVQESFVDGLLDCPHYTRPDVFEGRAVPAVLMSGNHADIRRWRLAQSLSRTAARRPALFAERMLTKEERQLLAEAGTSAAKQ